MEGWKEGRRDRGMERWMDGGKGRGGMEGERKEGWMEGRGG